MAAPRARAAGLLDEVVPADALLLEAARVALLSGSSFFVVRLVITDGIIDNFDADMRAAANDTEHSGVAVSPESSEYLRRPVWRAFQVILELAQKYRDRLRNWPFQV